jgi:hypothetical protein
MNVGWLWSAGSQIPTVATQRAMVMTMTLKRPQQSARKPGRTRPATEAALRYERRTYEAVGSWP